MKISQVGHVFGQRLLESRTQNPKLMTIAARIRKIREIRGWKQAAVATSMGITQQAYSCLEQNASNARLDTLKRFSNVVGVELSYLVALDVPVTDETLQRFGSIKFSETLGAFKKLEHKLEIFDDLLKGLDKSNHHRDSNLTVSVRRA
jgi:transcriptional regulator with XRE-family HTH domain